MGLLFTNCITQLSPLQVPYRLYSVFIYSFSICSLLIGCLNMCPVVKEERVIVILEFKKLLSLVVEQLEMVNGLPRVGDLSFIQSL